MKKRVESGFTMIELLVVIAIIGILAATSLANFQEYKKKAVQSKNKFYFHSARTALEARADTTDSKGAMYVYKRFGANITQVGTTTDELAPGMSFKDVPDTFYVYIHHNPSCTDAACYRTYVFSGECEWGDWKAYRLYGDGRRIDSDGYNGWFVSQC